MATAATAAKKSADLVFEWEGKDRSGKTVRGETRAKTENHVRIALRKQGVIPGKIRKRVVKRGKRIKPADIAIFTRQLATMLKSGIPIMQSIDIVAKGSPNPSVTVLLGDIRFDVESGVSLSTALRRRPKYFSPLYCNLVEAGEEAGILESLLDRLATYMENMESTKKKVKSALIYPIAVLVVAFVIVVLMMLFVIPAFQEVFSSFGAQLPAPTRMVITMSEWFQKHWWKLFLFLGVGGYLFFQAWNRSEKMQIFMDRLLLKLPIFGSIVDKSCVARWTRTLSTMFAAGVPLVESLDSVGGASGNIIYEQATKKIQREVATGISLTNALTGSKIFPNLVIQMTAIGEESGSLDHMLGKAADFYEEEVDTMVANLSTLMEPIIIVVLGVVIGGLVVALYLPIFNMGQVIG